jgi:hypothetical protein
MTRPPTPELSPLTVSGLLILHFKLVFSRVFGANRSGHQEAERQGPFCFEQETQNF